MTVYMHSGLGFRVYALYIACHQPRLVSRCLKISPVLRSSRRMMVPVTMRVRSEDDADFRLLASKGPSFERFPGALIYVNLVSSESLLAS